MTVPALALTVAVLLVGCSGPDDTPSHTAASTMPAQRASPSTPGGDQTGDGDAATPTPAGADVQDALAALRTAASEVSGEPFDMEHETRDGQAVWEIKVAVDGTEHELWVSTDGAEVVDQRTHGTPDDDVQKVEQAQVSAVEALQTSAEQAEGTLDEMEIDSEGGASVWEIDFRTSDGAQQRIVVDAMSGEVLQAR